MIRATALKWTSMLALMLLGTVTASAGTQRGTGEFIDDGVLTAKVKGALVADGTTKAHQINIETFQGVIQVSGFVSTEEEKMHAGELATSVEGVVEVRNDIEVRQTLANRSAGEAIDDATLTARVKVALIADEITRVREINVETYQGVVQVSGFVSTNEESTQANRVVLSVDGVQKVKNDLQIKQP